MNMLLITCKVNNFPFKLLLKSVENPLHNPWISTILHVWFNIDIFIYSPRFHLYKYWVINFQHCFQHTFQHLSQDYEQGKLKRSIINFNDGALIKHIFGLFLSMLFFRIFFLKW